MRVCLSIIGPPWIYTTLSIASDINRIRCVSFRFLMSTVLSSGAVTLFGFHVLVADLVIDSEKRKVRK
jgi:hypothetical protein